MSGPAQTPDPDLILHGTTVAFGDRAVLIRGASGAGKSGLGLQLMALGAVLVSDDRTALRVEGADLVARAPAAIAGMIEALGFGFLRDEGLKAAWVVAGVAVVRVEGRRLPPDRATDIAGVALPLLHKVESPHFPAAIRQYVMLGKWSTP
ncbi:MAG: hypothetical protein EP307_12375 [Rhodobacteraceae bacterium]|nr:MAG: hypothetical protein EP307_12375 [Paracoccaceae bacterium]